MARVFWSPEVVEILKQEYNKGTNDVYIAEMVGTTPAAVGRHRSVLGLVAYKREGYNRKDKTVKVKPQCKNTVLTYFDTEGKQHFMPIAGEDPKTIARNVMVKNGLKEVTLLQPVTKLVLNHVVEIPL